MLIGALLFGYFLTITQTPQNVTAFLTGLGIGKYGVLALIMLMIARLLMDALMIILTVPIIVYGVALGLIDLVWRHIVMTVERPHSSAGRDEHLAIRRGGGREDFDHLYGVIVHHHRPDPAVILIAFPIIALAAVAYVSL